MDHRQEASRHLAEFERFASNEDIEPDMRSAVRTLLHAALAAVDVLERIDDALRNTVGGRP